MTFTQLLNEYFTELELTKMIHTQNRFLKNAISSCCGGKGVSIWKDSSKQWECSDCGSPKSNDPNYLYGGNDGENEPKKTWKKYGVTLSKPECECGSSKVGSDRHSDYCPLYKKV